MSNETAPVVKPLMHRKVDAISHSMRRCVSVSCAVHFESAGPPTDVPEISSVSQSNPATQAVRSQFH